MKYGIKREWNSCGMQCCDWVRSGGVILTCELRKTAIAYRDHVAASSTVDGILSVERMKS